MNKYKFGKIYFLMNNITHEIFYIGSTIQSLNIRFNEHKSHSKNIYSKEYNSKKYEYIRKNDIKNISIYLLEEYSCESRYKLLEREYYYIKLFNPICNIKKTIEEEYRIKNYNNDRMKNYNNNSKDMFLKLY